MLGYLQTPYEVIDALKLIVHLPLPPKCWDYRYELQHPVYAGLGIEPRVLCVLSKHSAT